MLSHRGIERTVEYLMGEKQSVDLIEKCLLQDGEQCTLHTCNAYSEAQVEVTLSLAEDDKLVASVQCSMHRNTIDKNMELVQFCCKEDLWYWLSRKLRSKSVEE